MAWTIVPFAPVHQHGVIALISGIQRGEFQLPITPADQPDLMDIPGFYVHGAANGCQWGPGCFFVALDEAGLVAGSIALLNIGPDVDGAGQGALRKMFVRADMRGARGSGLAAELLGTLQAWCGENGVTRLFLGTTDRFLAAHRFYDKHGFTRVGKDSLPATFPVMSVDTVFYAKTLALI